MLMATPECALDGDASDVPHRNNASKWTLYGENSLLCTCDIDHVYGVICIVCSHLPCMDDNNMKVKNADCLKI